MTSSRRAPRSVVAAATLVALSATALPAQAAVAGEPGSRTAVSAMAAHDARHGLDRAALRGSLDAFHKAGMYGAYSAVRNGPARWQGATGIADVDSGRPTRPDFEHRVGSITKTFTAVAVLQQAGAGRIDLDAPVGRYIPDVVPGEQGRQVTVRMLLNHTSGIADYVLPAFPGILENPGKALDENRLRRIAPEELARLGLAAPPVAERGTHSYSNTNYILAGLILERVTGQQAEAYITRNVIRKAGLRHTYFPSSPSIKGPHARMYESFFGLIDPPRDYSVADMSWAGTAGALVSTTSDLNDFYRQLLSGRLLGAAQLREMKTTVPAYETEPGEEPLMRYGLGIYTLKMPNGGWYWGHDGAVFGAGTWALSSEDGRRQVAIGYNLMKYQRFDEQGKPLPDPITEALYAHVDGALAGRPTAPLGVAPQRTRPLPTLPIGPDALHQASLR
ncbi:serine hydrolase domain-containing protein [Streptomyces sp. P9(2023)]|uniref:serine hydrolase domain-containing protein n=1 Tax=Streptomyces sp. P9(2023) TaxID=3064394 RepID=UPI0028F446D9|nr:serine hydrolase domain-containing protein [Streptomyces sp. P9(2023)]MDT9686850.1 serine hydrolase domain-containing protein [Streptomyces sp. P9(2023)]